MITPNEALTIILREIRRLPAEEVAIEAAAGRVLAERIAARESLPLFTNSAMDGYAVRGVDVRGASAESPVSLRIIGKVPPGTLSDLVIGEGEAAKIFTGAPPPKGADTIIPVEKTAQLEDGTVAISDRGKKGQFFRPAGEDFKEGEVYFEPDHQLVYSDLPILAALGWEKVQMVGRPRVGIAVTGNELISPGDPLQPGEVRDVSSSLLTGALEEARCVVTHLGRLPDDPAALAERLGPALEECDVIVTAGGVSMGDHDHLRAVMQSLGLTEQFWKVAQKPGKPLCFAASGEDQKVVWFGLPGNPISVWTCLHLYLLPALKAMSGAPSEYQIVEAQAGEPMRGAPNLTAFWRVSLRSIAGRVGAYLTAGQGSHLVSSLIGVDGIAIIEPGRGAISPGDRLQVILVNKVRTLQVLNSALSSLGENAAPSYIEGVTS